MCCDVQFWNAFSPRIVMQFLKANTVAMQKAYSDIVHAHGSDASVQGYLWRTPF